MEQMVARVRALCKEKGTSLTKLEKSFGWGNGTIGKWKSSKSAPPADKLQKVADALDVSVAYILDGPNGEKKPIPEDELSKVRREAIELLNTMSDDELKVFIATLKGAKGG